MDTNYIDLFSGCGGLSLGMYKAGWKGLFAIEKNKDAFLTLKYNLIDNKNHFEWPQWLPKTCLDINDVIDQYKSQLIGLRGKVDLIVGGPPCQGFSMAGKRDENDIRNVLCHSYIDFIKLVKPKLVFFENVHGFTIGFSTSGKKGVPFSKIVISALEELGYYVEAKLIDVSNYGVPQKRKRYIIIGALNVTSCNFFEKLESNISIFLNKNNLSNYVTIDQAIGDLRKSNGIVDCPDSKRFYSGIYGVMDSKYQQFVRLNNNNIIPDSHRFANQRPETILVLEELMKVSSIPRRISPEDNLIKGLKKRGVTPLKSNYICSTITSIPDDFVHYEEPRIMTVRETARIQSFPDWYCFKGKYTTGGKLRKLDVPRYTQVANAVPPIFAEQVGIVLKEILK